MALIYVFPGQGSQTKGMGQGLFERFGELLAGADAVVGYSLRTLCLEDPEGRLGQTRYTQPALYTVNAFSYLARVADGGPRPEFVAGHSLGEYNALLAAGAFSFVDGLRLVNQRAVIMSRATGGGMAAVLGGSPGPIQEVLTKAGLTGVDVANHNADDQTVISGPKEEVAAAAQALTKAGMKRVMALNVSGAFHSRYMREAAAEFRGFLAGFAFQPLQLPVIANCTAQPYQQGEIAELLARQMCSPVRWVETVQWLRRQPTPTFEEIGPGKVLTSLLRRIG